MRTMAEGLLRGGRYVIASALVPLLAGCATGLASLPLPAPGGDMGPNAITVRAAFSNAMNLPNKARVKLFGADIGEVESIRADDFTAYVTMRIDGNAPVYAGATAELRSATPLGDIFVAIRPKSDQPPGARHLHDGDVIPLASTTSASAIEDVLGSASLLVNGGAVRRLVTVVNGAGGAIGGRGTKVADLLKNSNILISRLNARSGQIDTALRATSELAATLTARRQTIDQALEAAVPATSTLEATTAQLADLIEVVARITNQLNRFPSMRGTDTRSMIADFNRLADELNKISTNPNLNMNNWNRMLTAFIDSTAGPNVHAVGNVAQLAFGALPDKNYPGDPMFHGADGTDWHAAIGSLRYQWNLLLSKIYGPEHQPR
jgi:virulence factor Mce-like protein